jgi:DNA-binding NarL/FixJ family response regulator
MFEKTQKAATDLSVAVTEDANQAVSMAKAMVVPAVAGLFGTLAGYANKIKEGVESGEFVAKAKDAVASATKTAESAVADPLPTQEQNTTIAVLRASGKSDEQIAELLGVSIRTVKMASGE